MIRIGLIGLGRWGLKVANTLRELDKTGCVKFSAVCSSQADALSALPSGGKSFSDSAQMMSSGLIDAVIIATPPATHGPLLKLALERRMPAIVEKPLALSLSETESLKRAADAAQTPVLVDYIHLHHPAFLALVSAIESAGSPIVSMASQGGGPGPVRDYSALWDYGPHDLSMQLFLAKAEKPTIVRAEGSAQNFSAELSFASGIRGRFACSSAWPEKKRKLEVRTKAEIFLLDSGLEPSLSRASISNPEQKTPIAFQTETPLSSVIRRFAKGIESKTFGLEWNLEMSVILTDALEKTDALLRKNEKPS